MRYLVFYGRYYYPSGGCDDLIGRFETLDDCYKALSNAIMEYYTEFYEDKQEYFDYQKTNNWYHFYDLQENKKIKAEQNKILPIQNKLLDL